MHWMKEGGYSNDDPYFLNFTDDMSESDYDDESSESISAPPISRHRATPERKSSKNLIASPKRHNLLPDRDEEEEEES